METKGLILRKKQKFWQFLAFSVFKVSDARNISQKIITESCSTFEKLLIRTWMLEIHPFVLKVSKWNIKTKYTDMQFLAHSVYLVFVVRNQTEQLELPHVFTSRKIVDWCSDEWNPATCFWKRQACFQGKSGHSRILAKAVHKVCHARTFSRKFFSNDVLQIEVSWLRAWSWKSTWLFCEKLSLII